MERVALRTAIDRLPQQQRMLILLRYYKASPRTRRRRYWGEPSAGLPRLEKKAIQFLRQELQED